jgi:hypothetical protein
MTVEIVPHSGMIVISDFIGGYLVTRRYIGYTKHEAIKLFGEECHT